MVGGGLAGLARAGLALLASSLALASAMDTETRLQLRHEAEDMFYHGYQVLNKSALRCSVLRTASCRPTWTTPGLPTS